MSNVKLDSQSITALASHFGIKAKLADKGLLVSLPKPGITVRLEEARLVGEITWTKMTIRVDELGIQPDGVTAKFSMQSSATP